MFTFILVVIGINLPLYAYLIFSNPGFKINKDTSTLYVSNQIVFLIIHQIHIDYSNSIKSFKVKK
jgi:hypothetical protein